MLAGSEPVPCVAACVHSLWLWQVSDGPRRARHTVQAVMGAGPGVCVDTAGTAVCQLQPQQLLLVQRITVFCGKTLCTWRPLLPIGARLPLAITSSFHAQQGTFTACSAGYMTCVRTGGKGQTVNGNWDHGTVVEASGGTNVPSFELEADRRAGCL